MPHVNRCEKHFFISLGDDAITEEHGFLGSSAFVLAGHLPLPVLVVFDGKTHYELGKTFVSSSVEFSPHTVYSQTAGDPVTATDH